MFVTDEVSVGTGFRAAQARFVNLLHGTWLAEVSGAAYDGALTGLLRVGPAGPVTAKLVTVRFLDPVYRGDVMTVGLRWEATGATGALFPVLDADISISPARDPTAPAGEATAPAGEGTAPAGKESARLALSGSYRPPLGRLGARLDKVIMSRVAGATVRSLLHSVADAVTSPTTAGQAAENLRPGLRPAPETPMP
jgi:hypothetical protein